MTMIKLAKLEDSSALNLTFSMFQHRINQIFVISIIWSIGTTVLEEQRKPFDKFIRRSVTEPIKCQYNEKHVLKFDKSLLPPETGGVLIMEYEYDFVEFKFTHYKEALAAYDELSEIDSLKNFTELFIETFESLRIKTLLKWSVQSEFPVLLIGPTGIGKTNLISSYLREFNPEEHMTINLAFSAKTTSTNVQSIIDGKVERKRRDTFGPPMFGQKGIIFIDDLNLPMPDLYTYQPPLELLRQF